MASRERTNSVAEIRLASSLIELVSDIARRMDPERAAAGVPPQPDSMSRSAFTWGNAAWLASGLLAAPTVIGIAKDIGASLVALGVAPGVAIQQAWDYVQRKFLGREDAGVPLPYQDIRRTGPRSDSKWWQRDIPVDTAVVPDSYYVEDPAYEPWYRKLQQENATRMRTEYGGVPTSFNIIPGYAFDPKASRGPFPDQGMVPSAPPDAFSLYDQLTSPMPVRAEVDGDRVVEAQSSSMSQDVFARPDLMGGGGSTLERPSLSREHPFASIFQPGSMEQAAAIGGEAGWYSPPSPHAPFSDKTGLFGRHEAIEWAPGGTPLETRINMMKAMQAQVPQRLSWGTNWRISQILAQLHSGVIDEEQASRAIQGVVGFIRDMGAPPGVADDVLARAMAGMRSGVYGGLPERLIGGTQIPPSAAANWNEIRSPQDDPVRGPMMDNLATMEQRMRGLSGGWSSPLAGNPMLEV